jgi:plasmid stability protein
VTALTVRNLDEATDRALRLAAAELGISKEEFVRRSLRKIVAQGTAADTSPPSRNGAALLARLRARFAHGYAADLELPPRDSLPREVDLGRS